MSLIRILIIATLVMFAAVAFALRSGPEERIAMLVRDGRKAEAATEIKHMLATGLAKPRLLMTLAQLEEALGDQTQASATMDVYVLARPHDRDALAWLVKTYEASDESAGLAEALTKLTALEPTLERISRLAALHRYEGHFEEECAVLERFSAVVPLAPEMLERLSALLAAQGRAPRAIEILREADALINGSGERARKLLFELLVQSRLYDEAATRAQSWLVRWNKPWIAAELTLRLAAMAPFEAGRKLAAAAVSLHPDARLYLAKTLAEQGNRRLAATLLTDWPFPGVALTPVEVEGFVAATVAAGDPGAAWGAFAKLRGQVGTAEAQARFAEAIAGHYGLGSIAMLQPPLPPEILGHRPLFAVRLALSRGQDQSARRILGSADLGAMLPGERMAWLDLLLRTGTGFEAITILDQYQQRQALPAALLPAYRALAGQLGRRPGNLSVAGIGQRLAGIVP